MVNIHPIHIGAAVEGPQGPPGLPGAQGEIGPTGPPGDGISNSTFGSSTSVQNKIVIEGGSNIDRIYRMRTGGSTPAGVAGLQFSNFDTLSYYMYANASGFIIGHTNSNPSAFGERGTVALRMHPNMNVDLTGGLSVNGDINVGTNVIIDGTLTVGGNNILAPVEGHIPVLTVSSSEVISFSQRRARYTVLPTHKLLFGRLTGTLAARANQTIVFTLVPGASISATAATDSFCEGSVTLSGPAGSEYMSSGRLSGLFAQDGNILVEYTGGTNSEGSFILFFFLAYV